VSNEERDGCLSLCCIEMGVLEEHHGGTHSLEGKDAEQFIIVPLGIDHEEVERLEALLIEERCDRGPVHQGFDDSILESRKLATELEDRLLSASTKAALPGSSRG